MSVEEYGVQVCLEGKVGGVYAKGEVEKQIEIETWGNVGVWGNNMSEGVEARERAEAQQREKHFSSDKVSETCTW